MSITEKSPAICRITAIMNKEVASSTRISEILVNSGVRSMEYTAGRDSMLCQRKGMIALFLPQPFIVENPVDIFSFLVPESVEKTALSLIIEKCGLDHHGRGTVFSEDIQLIRAHALCMAENHLKNAGTNVGDLPSGLQGICCITQRGDGEKIARIALNTGTCVPVITFGCGTGLRDKLGLLRITISADKEMTLIFAKSYDAERILNMIIDVGKLDQPGKGFVYLFPLKSGVVNAKIFTGVRSTAASMEQIIGALDELKGNHEWRKHWLAQEGNMDSCFIHDLLDLVLICDDGHGDKLVAAAMAAGAAGATIGKTSHLGDSGHGHDRISPARETCNMIIPSKLLPEITMSLDNAGAFNNQSHGLLFSRPVYKACTYLGKNQSAANR